MLKKILYGVAAILLVALLYNALELYRFSSQRNEVVQQKGLTTMNALKSEVDTILSEIVFKAKDLANRFGTKDYTKEEVQEALKTSALQISAVQGITACYQPYAFADNQPLFCPYFNKATNNFIYVEDGYDYTKDATKTTWYSEVRDKGPRWVEPYYAEIAQDWYIDYGIPFYYTKGSKKGQVRGIITISISIERFKKLVLSLSLGKTGYGIVTSRRGTFLSHPVNDYIGTVNLKSISATEPNTTLVSAYEQLLQGKTGHVKYLHEDGDKTELFFYDKIPITGWGIGLSFSKQELLGVETGVNIRYIRLSLLLSAFLLVLIALYFNKDALHQNEIWQLSALATLLLVGNVILIGFLEHNGSRRILEQESAPISDVASLGSFVSQQQTRLGDLKLPEFIPIPTGIFVERMAFVNSYNLNIGGVIWQKYPLGLENKVQMGFRIPQTSPFAEASLIEERYRKQVKGMAGNPGYLLIGWDFRVTVQQYLNYKNYPFDKRHISIYLVPISNEDRLIFTPDFASYEFTNPTKKPGLNQKVRVSGNRITKSYFNYSTESFDTDFGFGSKTLFENVPVLHYNIELRRILLNTFVTYLIPIFVVLIMMFILIIASSKTDERQGIIEGMAAFFFVLIFSHIDLRKEIITAELIYMEYFYFVTYLMIILSTFNLVTYTKSRTRIFDYNDNQLFKAAYFPLFFLCILIVTISKFY